MSFFLYSLLIFSLPISSSSTTSTNSMIVVWGKPTDLSGATVNSTLDKDQCVEACLSEQRCVLAHIMLNTTTCNMFLFNSTTTITKTNATDESVVAFKVTGSGTCPIGDNPPTFDNQTAKGYILINDDPKALPVKLWYNITFEQNTWSFSTKVVPGCPNTNWRLIPHQDGNDICVVVWMIFKSGGPPYETLDYTSSSTTICPNLNATLPGINYPTDNDDFHSRIMFYLDLFPTTNFYVRIDGKRTESCQGNPSSSSCTGPAGFTFTDKQFTNFDNYNWVSNSSARDGDDDDCLVYVVNGNATLQVDVRSCTDKDTLHPYGLLCVRAAYSES